MNPRPKRWRGKESGKKKGKKGTRVAWVGRKRGKRGPFKRKAKKAEATRWTIGPVLQPPGET